MRRVFLWAARNRWLKERLPRLRFMKRAVRRFMPGETLEDALAAALPLQAAGIGTMYTRLGENLENLAGGRCGRRPLHRRRRQDRRRGHHRRDLGQADPARARPRRRTSASPTSSGSPSTRPPPARTSGSTWRAATTSSRRSSLYERLRAVQPRTGICLQAYLRRTAADFERLRPLDPAIRLVKGAYDEKESIAYTNRRSVDSNYVGLAVRFLLDGRGRPIRLGLGTHDVALIEQIAEQVGAAGVGRDAFEIEMLYGIRTDQQYRLANAGYRVQALIAYGEHWYPWYMRRLAERPANVWFALRQMLP